jgi:hypothetical protein
VKEFAMKEFFGKVWEYLKPWLATTWMGVSAVPLTWYVTLLLCLACFFAGCACRAEARDPAAKCPCVACQCQQGQPCGCGAACSCDHCPGLPAGVPCTLVVTGVGGVDFEIGGTKYKANGKDRRLVTPPLQRAGHYDFVACTDDVCVTGFITVIPGAVIDVTLDFKAGSLGCKVRETKEPPRAVSYPQYAPRFQFAPFRGNCPGGVCPGGR